MQSPSAPTLPPSQSRYTILGEIGAGGMATVQYAQFRGPGGFVRPVAIKRLHPHLANDPDFVSLFLDEARLSARITHANVIATLDVLSDPSEIAVVMEYVHGESLAGVFDLARSRGETLPYPVATHLLVGVLHGLHAAHETRGENGEVLGIVHRDVSPENILVGADGVPRLLDFGIAKAKGRARTTPSGELKGKLGYIAPEQYHGANIDRRVDVYGASVVLWEALTGHPLFKGETDAAVVHAVMNARVPRPSAFSSAIPAELDEIVMRGLSRVPEQRFATAHEMAVALEREVGIASQSQVGEWLQGLAGDLLRRRAAGLKQLRDRSTSWGSEQSSPRAGTRRLVSTRAAHVPTRAVAAPAPDPSAEAAGSVPGRSAPRLRRGRPAKRTAAALGLLVLTAGALWLASALHADEAMPSATPSADLPIHPAPSRAAPAPDPLERGAAEAEASAEGPAVPDPSEPRAAEAGASAEGPAVPDPSEPRAAEAGASAEGPAVPDSSEPRAAEAEASAEGPAVPDPSEPRAAEAGVSAQRLPAAPEPSARRAATEAASAGRRTPSDPGTEAAPSAENVRPNRARPRTRRPRRRPDEPRAQPRRVNCTPPYVVDALGIRRWKKSCL